MGRVLIKFPEEDEELELDEDELELELDELELLDDELELEELELLDELLLDELLEPLGLGCAPQLARTKVNISAAKLNPRPRVCIDFDNPLI